ncbi:hypothetical protein AB4K20DRAFT_1795621, partial [Rhizopus microsporus]
HCLIAESGEMIASVYFQKSMLIKHKHSFIRLLLLSIETQIGNFQDEITEIESLKAERVWLEQIQYDDLPISVFIEEIIQHNQRLPKQSSPGGDDLPYEILNLLILCSLFHPIVHRVYNGTLQRSLFSSPWNEFIIALLSKKDDLSQLRNYLSIILVNTHTRAFTRIISSRFMKVCRRIINQHQLGFIHGCYIAENDMIIKSLWRMFIPLSTPTEQLMAVSIGITFVKFSKL